QQLARGPDHRSAQGHRLDLRTHAKPLRTQHDGGVPPRLVSEGGLEPPRPMRALAPQASASAIPPLGPARPLYPWPAGRTLDARPAGRVARGLTVHGRRVPTPTTRP